MMGIIYRNDAHHPSHTQLGLLLTILKKKT
jgi:hypothetical protein